MSRRNSFLIAACAFGVVISLLLQSFVARAIAASIVALITAIVLIRAFRESRVQEDASNDLSEEASPPQIFPFGELFEATMTGMREGLLVVNKDMRVVASNPAAHRLFNLSGRKLDSQRLTELTRNPAIYSAFLDALQGNERSGVKVETRGTERLVFDLRVVPLHANGKGGSVPEGALGVFIDVTRIERLESVRQEFLSNVSHELRTPLTAILAFVETLETGALADEASALRFLSIIRKNASRMHGLIDDILELSAIEAGNVPVNAEMIELRPIVNDVIASVASIADAQGISLINATPNEASVFADARRVEQMLTNLLENAIKFNRPGGQVIVQFEPGSRDEATGTRDKILVKDTGEGIPAQHLDRLFERFYRVDRARSREMGGTGLGLAIVKHLARAHGGEVTVASELGKGSTFTIELPRKL